MTVRSDEAPLVVEGTPAGRDVALVEIVVPVHNEEAALAPSIIRLHQYLSERFPLSWVVTIVDNASRDRTWAVACRLAGELGGMRAVHLAEKGRGRALRAAWTASASPVVAYMDVDLSTDLDGLLPLVAPLLSGHSDVAIGSRLARGAKVVRGPKRELVSRGYNLILKAAMGNGFSDAQCGFKAVRSDVAHALLPLIEDDGWFFDTELLVLAEHNGLRIHEVPVDWVDDADSRVDISSTAKEDLKGIWRLLRRFAAGDGTLPPGLFGSPASRRDLRSQLGRFAAVGIGSTALFALLFLALTGPLGAFGADIVALAVAAVANVVANRRITFGYRGRPGRARHFTAGLVVAALPLPATLLAIGVAPSVPVALALVIAVHAAATVARFLLLRRWVFRPEQQTRSNCGSAA